MISGDEHWAEDEWISVYFSKELDMIPLKKLQGIMQFSPCLF